MKLGFWSTLGRGFNFGNLQAGVIQWLLKDDFTDTVAAGSVNGTNATPTGGARTVTDTNSKISVGSGVLNFVTGNVASDGVRWPVVTRQAGRALIAEVNWGNSGRFSLGWDNDGAGGNLDNLNNLATAIQVSVNGGSSFGIGTIAASASYKYAIVHRATGLHFFIKGGAYTTWTLMYSSLAGSANAIPGLLVAVNNSVFTSDFVRIPQNLIVTTPVASDAFTRADGVLGTTGGGGSEESGGSGLTWTAQKGTWGVATNKAACSALTDSLGIATVPCGTTNVMAEAVITRSAGNMGMALRYTDADNYIKVFYDGTNWQVDDIVGGVANTILAATAATYGATKRTVVSLNGTKLRLYYGDAAVGAESTTAITTGNAHGLYTSDTGATFDNFVVWSKGNGGEYESTFNRYTV